jgi:hypothetical protein
VIQGGPPDRTWPEHGRRKPYTQTGIRRLPCFRCGAPASQQWNICSDGNLYRPICLECDIQLNALVLHFMGFEHWRIAVKMAEYRRRMEETYGGR